MIKWWENLAYYILTLDGGILKLNTPDLKLICPGKSCGGRLVAYKQSPKGLHFLCLRCFNRWVKPLRGQLYREIEIVKRLKGYEKINRRSGQRI